MTIEEIDQKQADETIKFTLAKKIRELIDKAKESLESKDPDEFEAEVIALVTDE